MPFRDVIGHRPLVALLRRAVAGGTLPPSLLLSGPSGVGKRFTAVAVAQALNCVGQPPGTRHQPLAASAEPSALSPKPPVHGPQPPLSDACGVCTACTRIAAGKHTDVLIVGPGETGSIKIEQVREIIERVAYRPFEGLRRVVIIHDADALVPAAQSALLKTLEEPPPGSVLMLLTTRPDVLLPTVRSRCPQLRFSQLAASDIAAALVARGSSESQARAVAATADGSLGYALAVVQKGAEGSLEARDIAHQVLEHAASTGIPSRRIDGASALLAKSAAPPAVDRGKTKAAAEREQMATRLRATATLLRDMVALGVGADEHSLANPDMKPVLERLVPAYHGERGIRAFAAIDRALTAVKSNVSVKLVADWLVLQL